MSEQKGTKEELEINRFENIHSQENEETKANHHLSKTFLQIGSITLKEDSQKILNSCFFMKKASLVHPDRDLVPNDDILIMIPTFKLTISNDLYLFVEFINTIGKHQKLVDSQRVTHLPSSNKGTAHPTIRQCNLLVYFDVFNRLYALVTKLNKDLALLAQQHRETPKNTNDDPSKPTSDKKRTCGHCLLRFVKSKTFTNLLIGNPDIIAAGLYQKITKGFPSSKSRFLDVYNQDDESEQDNDSQRQDEEFGFRIIVRDTSFSAPKSDQEPNLKGSQLGQSNSEFIKIAENGLCSPSQRGAKQDTTFGLHLELINLTRDVGYFKDNLTVHITDAKFRTDSQKPAFDGLS